MRPKILIILFISLLLSAQTGFAQDDSTTPPDSSGVSSGITGGAVLGSVTVDGKVYQQFSLRADIPIGKFGFGLDIQMLFDEAGKIRTDDWDEWHDYLDKIYYIRYGKKSDPFYIKVGGLDYSYIGYSNIINGYSNMVQYPTRKRYGGELSFFVPSSKYRGKPLVGGELFFNDMKEAFIKAPAKPGIVFGTRAFYRPLRFLEVGVSFAGDLNEYNAFLDKDGDGVPNLIDNFPSNANLATDMDLISDTDWNHLMNDSYWGANRADRYDRLFGLGLVPGDTTRMGDLFNLHDQTSKMYAASFDIGLPIIEKENLKFDIYSHITQLWGSNNKYGWGVALPGVQFIIGSRNVQNFLTIRAEYRRSSTQFLFGYFNNTYELERAQFATDRSQVITKQQSLLGIQDELNGVYASAELNLFNYVVGYLSYQDLMGGTDTHLRSLHGEVRLGEAFKKIVSFADVKGYYVQNNVQDFREWKTPSTIMGATVGYNFKGAIMGIDYRWAFQDIDGDGVIRGDNETFKTISFKTAVNF